MPKTIQTKMVCPECGNVFPIMRKMNKQKKLFHRKWLYCPKCQKTTNHIEGKDLDKLLKEIELKEKSIRTEEEIKVYKLVKKENSNEG